MPKATIALAVRVVPEVMEALRRQATLSGWSQGQLVEAFALNLQDTWLARFTEDERV